MKTVGLILIAFGLAMLVFVAVSLIKERNKIVSPLPEDKGIKVIFISPTK